MDRIAGEEPDGHQLRRLPQRGDERFVHLLLAGAGELTGTRGRHGGQRIQLRRRRMAPQVAYVGLQSFPAPPGLQQHGRGQFRRRRHQLLRQSSF